MTPIAPAASTLTVVLADSAGDYWLAGILTVAAALIVIVLMMATSSSEEDQGS